MTTQEQMKKKTFEELVAELKSLIETDAELRALLAQVFKKS